MLVAAIAGFGAIVAVRQGWASLDALQYGLNGVTFGLFFAWTLGKRLPFFYVLLAGFIPGALFFGLCETVWYRQEYQEVLKELFAYFTSTAGAQLSGYRVEYSDFVRFVPISESFRILMVTVLLAFVFYRFAGRSRPRISRFRVPDWFAWVLITGLTLQLTGILKPAGYYLLVVSVLFYLCNGVAVIRLFFERWGNAYLIEALFYAVQAVLFLVPLLLIGVLETWLNMRGKLAHSHDPKTENHI